MRLVSWPKGTPIPDGAVLQPDGVTLLLVTAEAEAAADAAKAPSAAKAAGFVVRRCPCGMTGLEVAAGGALSAVTARAVPEEKPAEGGAIDARAK